MRRRAFLGLAAGTAAASAGCTDRTLPAPLRAAGTGTSAGCPAVIDVDRTVCPAAAGPLTVARSSETVSGDAWSLRVSVTNRTERPVGLNPNAWSVSRRTAAGWAEVAPDAAVEPWLELAPGADYAWQLTAGEAGRRHADQRVSLDLAVGTYAFAVPLRAAQWVGVVAPFAVADRPAAGRHRFHPLGSSPSP